MIKRNKNNLITNFLASGWFDLNIDYHRQCIEKMIRRKYVIKPIKVPFKIVPYEKNNQPR